MEIRLTMNRIEKRILEINKDIATLEVDRDELLSSMRREDDGRVKMELSRELRLLDYKIAVNRGRRLEYRTLIFEEKTEVESVINKINKMVY